MPAATDLQPSLKIARASTVAVVVPSPAMSFVLDATCRHATRGAIHAQTSKCARKDAHKHVHHTQTHLTDELGAHVLEAVLEIDRLGNGDTYGAVPSTGVTTRGRGAPHAPSFVILGAPKDWSIRTLRPFGPSVTPTASASLSTPTSICGPPKKTPHSQHRHATCGGGP